MLGEWQPPPPPTLAATSVTPSHLQQLSWVALLRLASSGQECGNGHGSGGSSRGVEFRHFRGENATQVCCEEGKPPCPPPPPPHPSHPRPSPALGSPPMYSLRLAASKLVHFCGRPHATVHHSRRGQAPPLQASVCKLQPFGKPHASSPRHLSQPVTSDAPFPIFIACNMQLADSMMPCAPNL